MAAGVSETTAYRALRRFARLHLVCLHHPEHRGRGYVTGVEVLWRAGGPCTGKADQDADAAISLQVGKGRTSENPRICHTDAWRRDLTDSTPVTPYQALNLVMGEVRMEIRRWPITWTERNRILTGVGASVHRTFGQDGGPIPRGRARALAQAVIRRLREGEGVSRSLRRACSFGGHVVAEAYAEAVTRHRADVAERQAAEARRRELDAERRAARATWTPEAVAQVEALVARGALARRTLAASAGRGTYRGVAPAEERGGPAWHLDDAPMGTVSGDGMEPGRRGGGPARRAAP
ncbi:TPA: hypothetical protein DCY67_02180 [Candidatus Acetothermia bacterium]|nr:hypothetical protein [Candidatus Acetothermia bacterium]